MQAKKETAPEDEKEKSPESSGREKEKEVKPAMIKPAANPASEKAPQASLPAKAEPSTSKEPKMMWVDFETFSKVS